MASDEFQIGDLVWGKMTGFPKWPGIITEPTYELAPKVKPNQFCIFFFGSNNYALLDAKKLEKYETAEGVKITGSALKTAIQAIEEYKKSQVGGPPPLQPTRDDPFDQLLTTPTAQQSPTVKKGKTISAKKRQLSKGNGDRLSLDAESDTERVTPAGRGPSAKLATGPMKKKRRSDYLPTETTIAEASSSSASARRILERAPILPRPDTPPLNVDEVSPKVLAGCIVPSEKTIGFLGLGLMGSGLVKNLLQSKHTVHLWDKNPEKAQEFTRIGANLDMTPSDVMEASDIVFCCMEDENSAKEIVFGNCGVLKVLNSSKAYVEMTLMSPESMKEIGDTIKMRDARFLEVQLIGTKEQAAKGELLVLMSGNRTLSNDIMSCIESFGYVSYYYGDNDMATKMGIILRMGMAANLLALSEMMAVADRVGIRQRDLLSALEHTQMFNELCRENGEKIINVRFEPSVTLNSMIKSSALSVRLCENIGQQLPLGSVVADVMRYAARLGYGENDASAVYFRSRF
ncbi:3-hydroxyisobutyrate dehydrogenase [Nesidiocoris tenuis]|nr:3-hydroxyisobutyrate dehydrogenase [Nesidiocoris tenuis]